VLPFVIIWSNFIPKHHRKLYSFGFFYYHHERPIPDRVSWQQIIDKTLLKVLQRK